MCPKADQKVFEVLASLNRQDIGARDILKSIFINYGFAFEDIIEQDIDDRRALAVYCASRGQAALFKRRLSSLKLPWLDVDVTVLYQDEWLTRWKKDWKPFRLTRSLDVVPVWCRAEYKAGRRLYILLDTISSFGTGLHETTKFMAEFIEELDSQCGRFLDVGTGTGILALAALKYGAKDVTAIDSDDLCINASRANFKANGYEAAGCIIHRDLLAFKPSTPFDCVAANLVTHDLITMKQKIISFVKPGGWLAVSGISLENLPRLRRAFASLPLRCLKIKKGKNWSALLFKKTGSQSC